ncbi:MAG: hypothetical protein QM765_28695 [Myxococcales bacterium]
MRIRMARLTGARGGASVPGTLVLQRFEATDERLLTSLRHEVAHEYLRAVCPAHAKDRLLQESFAVATSGEAAAWKQGPPMSVGEAKRVLEKAGPDTPRGRRALAWLVGEGLSAEFVQRLEEVCGGGPRRSNQGGLR